MLHRIGARSAPDLTVSLSRIALLLATGAQVATTGASPLALACRVGWEEGVKLILDHSRAPVSVLVRTPTAWGLPLIEACHSGNVRLVKFMLQKKVRGVRDAAGVFLLIARSSATQTSCASEKLP